MAFNVTVATIVERYVNDKPARYIDLTHQTRPYTCDKMAA